MEPFDDKIPEEIEQEQEELQMLLPRVYQRPAPSTPGEQQAIIARVRERLLASRVNRAAEAAPVQPPDMPAGYASRTPVSHREQRGWHMLNRLVAILIVGALIGVSLVLFAHRAQTTNAPSIGPVGSGVLARTESGGIEMSLWLTPGPYFLSEMLAVDIALTNHTYTPLAAGFPFVPNPCGYNFGVQINGGSAPYYTIPISTDHSCPGIFRTTPLAPGQTLTLHKYLPLTSSGHMKLATGVAIYSAQATQTSNGTPFTGPSLQITVNPQVPVNRKLSFKMDGSHAIAIVPQGAPSPLLYLDGISCQDFGDSGTTGTGNYGWQQITNREVNLPGCPGKNVQWSFAFAVPGYAIVTGNYVSASDPHA